MADALRSELGGGYTVALNLASTVPDWLGMFRARPMSMAVDDDHLFWLEWGYLDELDNYQPGALLRWPLARLRCLRQARHRHRLRSSLRYRHLCLDQTR